MVQLAASVGGPFPPSGSPSLPTSCAERADLRCHRVDAVDVGDLVGERLVDQARVPRSGRSRPRWCSARRRRCPVRLGEQVGEARPHGVAEHERAGEERDAEQDGEHRAEQAPLVRPHPFEAHSQHRFASLRACQWGDGQRSDYGRRGRAVVPTSAVETVRPAASSCASAARMSAQDASPCSHQPSGTTRHSSGHRHTPSAAHSATVSSSGGAHPLLVSNQRCALRTAVSASTATVSRSAVLNS